jgi:hypothetical protein
MRHTCFVDVVEEWAITFAQLITWCFKIRFAKIRHMSNMYLSYVDQFSNLYLPVLTVSECCVVGELCCNENERPRCCITAAIASLRPFLATFPSQSQMKHQCTNNLKCLKGYRYTNYNSSTHISNSCPLVANAVLCMTVVLVVNCWPPLYSAMPIGYMIF